MDTQLHVFVYVYHMGESQPGSFEFDMNLNYLVILSDTVRTQFFDFGEKNFRI